MAAPVAPEQAEIRPNAMLSRTTLGNYPARVGHGNPENSVIGEAIPIFRGYTCTTYHIILHIHYYSNTSTF
jgi:hypothetical protein